jgi:hypothetical protein
MTVPKTQALAVPIAQAASPLPALESSYNTLRKEAGVLYRLEPSHSELRIHAFRAGSARQFGHNHVLSATRFAGYAFLARPGAQGTRFELALRLDEMDLGLAEQRSALGESFATQLSPEQVQGTREHMLGPYGLQAEQFPWVRIASLQIQGDAPKYAAQLEVELHGQRRVLWVPLTVQTTPSMLQVQGAVVLQQTDFGIKPYTVLGGLLAVQDTVVVEFTLRGESRPE